MMAAATTAIARTGNGQIDSSKPVGNDFGKFQTFLEGKGRQIAQICAGTLTPERLTRIVLNNVARTPGLRACTMISIYRSVLQAAEMGLTPGSALGEGYLVPFVTRNGPSECVFIPGYRGLCTLARRSGEVESVMAFPVYDGDDFDYQLGDEPHIRHKPSLTGERGPGKMLFVYAVGRLRNTTVPVLDVMTRPEVDLIRGRSKASEKGPWATDYVEMARKTVVKRLCKYLPMSVDLAKALALDNSVEAGEVQSPAEFEVIDIDPETGEVLNAAQPPEPTKGVDAVMAQVAGNGAKAPEAPSEPDPFSDS